MIPLYESSTYPWFHLSVVSLIRGFTYQDSPVMNIFDNGAQ